MCTNIDINITRHNRKIVSCSRSVPPPVVSVASLVYQKDFFKDVIKESKERNFHSLKREITLLKSGIFQSKRVVSNNTFALWMKNVLFLNGIPMFKKSLNKLKCLSRRKKPFRRRIVAVGRLAEGFRCRIADRKVPG